jgi:hypothetical protein
MGTVDKVWWGGRRFTGIPILYPPSSVKMIKGKRAKSGKFSERERERDL